MRAKAHRLSIGIVITYLLSKFHDIWWKTELAPIFRTFSLLRASVYPQCIGCDQNVPMRQPKAAGTLAQLQLPFQACLRVTKPNQAGPIAWRPDQLLPWPGRLTSPPESNLTPPHCAVHSTPTPPPTGGSTSGHESCSTSPAPLVLLHVSCFTSPAP